MEQHHKPGVGRGEGRGGRVGVTLGGRWQGHSVVVQQQAIVIGLLLAAVAGVGICAVVAVALWQRRAALRRAARGIGGCCLPGPDPFFPADMEADGYAPPAPYGPDMGWEYDRRWGVGTPDPYAQPGWGDEAYAGVLPGSGGARFGGASVLPEYGLYGGGGGGGARAPGGGAGPQLPGRMGDWGMGDAQGRGSGGRAYTTVPYAYMQSPVRRTPGLAPQTRGTPLPLLAGPVPVLAVLSALYRLSRLSPVFFFQTPGACSAARTARSATSRSSRRAPTTARGTARRCNQWGWAAALPRSAQVRRSRGTGRPRV